MHHDLVILRSLFSGHGSEGRFWQKIRALPVCSRMLKNSHIPSNWAFKIMSRPVLDKKRDRKWPDNDAFLDGWTFNEPIFAEFQKLQRKISLTALKKVNDLAREIWQHSNVDTLFFRNTAGLARGAARATLIIGHINHGSIFFLSPGDATRGRGRGRRSAPR